MLHTFLLCQFGDRGLGAAAHILVGILAADLTDHNLTKITVHMLDRNMLARCIAATFAKGHQCTRVCASAAGRMPRVACSLASRRQDSDVGGMGAAHALAML